MIHKRSAKDAHLRVMKMLIAQPRSVRAYRKRYAFRYKNLWH